MVNKTVNEQKYTKEMIDLKTDRLVSIVIPFFNEEESVLPLYRKLISVLHTNNLNYELIFVNDGSKDGTLEILKQVFEKDTAHISIINLRRNFGQTAALAAGFDYAKGDVIVTMDGDLQNDPEDMPYLLEKLDEGHDIVSGWRSNRKDNFLSRVVTSKFGNLLISWITGVELHDYGCTLKAYKKEVLKAIYLFGDMHRFIPALASWSGISVAEIKVNHQPRQYGKTKYGLGRISEVLLDLIIVKFFVSYKARPIRFFGFPGLLLVISGLFLAGVLSIMWFGFGIEVALKPIIAMLMFSTGVQFIMIGIIGELVMRVYFEGSEKPIYVIKNIIGEGFRN